MRKGSSIIGLKILARAEGAEIGHVRDLIFDHNSDEVLALLTSDRGFLGLTDARVISWSEITNIGPDSVVVQSRESEIKAHSDERVARIMDNEHKMSGTRVYTDDGKDLGSFADMYVDEVSGRVLGYEISGGFVSDTLSGKRFMVPPSEITVGEDAVIVPSEVADDLEAQRQTQPGGLGAGVKSASETVGGVLDSTKQTLAGAVDSAKEKYADIASASVDKQKEFVVGKTAGRDVTYNATPLEAPIGERIENVATGAPVSVPQETMVHQGEVITREHADRAESAGVLGQLLLAAGSAAAGDTLNAGREKIGGIAENASSGAQGAGGSLQQNAAQAAIGKTAGRDVSDARGSLIAAAGMTITEAMLEHARVAGKENELIAAAGLGTAQDGLDTAKAHASNLWDTIKEKAAELSGTAQDKKAEYDAAAQQKNINNALGRPVTRVILDKQDAVLLNTGDLITHAAVERARAAGVLDVLLDSVYLTDPEITPEMLRARESGEEALPTQAQPSGGPITATVATDENTARAQDTNPS